MNTRSFPFLRRTTATLPVFAIVLICGCGDSRKVAMLQSRIDALEKRQREDGAKLDSMSERIVTKAIEVEGIVQAERLHLQSQYVASSYVEITPGKIELNSLQKKSGISTGHIAVITSSSLSLKDGFEYDARNSFELQLKGNGGGVLSERANRIQIMSRDENEVLVYRDLWHESPMETTASFHSNSAGKKVTYLHTKSGAGGAFGVRFISVSGDGIVRFQLANASALPVTNVVGVLEWFSRKKDKNGQSKFVVDQRMETGAWISVAVATSLSEGELWYFQLKDIEVGAAFFK